MCIRKHRWHIGDGDSYLWFYHWTNTLYLASWRTQCSESHYAVNFLNNLACHISYSLSHNNNFTLNVHFAVSCYLQLRSTSYKQVTAMAMCVYAVRRLIQSSLAAILHCPDWQELLNFQITIYRGFKLQPSQFCFLPTVTLVQIATWLDCWNFSFFNEVWFNLL
jgi:hypothetical protein